MKMPAVLSQQRTMREMDITTGVSFLINSLTYCSKVGLYFFNEDAGGESFWLQ